MYPYLVMHPADGQSEKCFINITDKTLNEFCAVWTTLDDNLQSEFGWDLPLHTDGDQVAYERIELDDIECKDDDAYVLDMTMIKYVALVYRYIKGD